MSAALGRKSSEVQKSNEKLTLPDFGDSNTPSQALPSQHLFSPPFVQNPSLPLPLPAR